MQPHGPLTPPGWYNDPYGPWLRYWDGYQWTGHYRPLPQPPVPVRQASNASGWIALIMVLAIIIGGYAWYHSDRYGDCIVKPGFFNWPNTCPL